MTKKVWCRDQVFHKLLESYGLTPWLRSYVQLRTRIQQWQFRQSFLKIQCIIYPLASLSSRILYSCCTFATDDPHDQISATLHLTSTSSQRAARLRHRPVSSTFRSRQCLTILSERPLRPFSGPENCRNPPCVQQKKDSSLRSGQKGAHFAPAHTTGELNKRQRMQSLSTTPSCLH